MIRYLSLSLPFSNSVCPFDLLRYCRPIFSPISCISTAPFQKLEEVGVDLTERPVRCFGGSGGGGGGQMLAASVTAN